MDTYFSAPKVGLPELSEDSANELIELRKGDSQTFYAYVVSLRENRWPLRAIATPLGVSRTAVQRWTELYKGKVPVPVTEPLPEVVPKQVKAVYAKFELAPRQASELRNLAHEASKVRRFTDKNAKSRKDAARLERLLREYTESGASLGQLANACHVSRSSIAQRLRKPQDGR